MGPRPPTRTIVFVSSNEGWGGSEELWSRTAAALARDGHHVTVIKQFDRCSSQAAALRAGGCRVVELLGLAWAPRRARGLIGSIWKLSRPLRERVIAREVRRRRPDLLVVSQGVNYDGWYAGLVARRLGVPFAMLSQKASDLYWPSDGMRAQWGAAYRDAAAALFVSEHNRALTEQQLGLALPDARVVRNPYHADWEATTPWPGETGGYRLTCLARLDAREKGQDLLLRVLALPKWRARPLSLRLHGAGHNEAGLRAMAELLGLTSVAFGGFADAPAAVWADAHGLILPSRCEGLPLSLIEAMLHGRVAIVTDVGGNREAVIDGTTGFLAEAATETALDAALERAWARRAEWQAIGAAAAGHARTLVGPDPVGDFAALLLELIDRTGQS